VTVFVFSLCLRLCSHVPLYMSQMDTFTPAPYNIYKLILALIMATTPDNQSDYRVLYLIAITLTNNNDQYNI